MKRKIRVCHLIHHLDIGGAEILLAQFLSHSDRKKIENHVACLKRTGALYHGLEEQGFRMFFVRKKWGIDLFAVMRLASYLRRANVDIVHTHDFSASFWGRVAAIIARTPAVLCTVHAEAGWHKPAKHRFWGKVLPAPARFVAVSNCVRDSLVRHEGIPRDLITVIANGICLKRSFLSSVPEPSERLSLEPGVKIAGMIARCSPEKGGRFFVKAVALLAREGMNINGVIVGDGPELPALKSLAASLGTGNMFHFPGADPNVLPWLRRFDVMVCPSLQESFGMSALEAQAAGTPVAASSAVGLAEVLHDGEDALLAPPGDSRLLADNIRRILQSPGLAERLRQAGKRNVDARYSIRRMTEQYMSLYLELAGGMGSRTP